MKKVNIVIPMYTIEKYLPDCINSVINQTYHNIEIILVVGDFTDLLSRICDC